MASPTRAWLPILVLFADLLAAASAHAAQYVVDGFTLGDPVQFSSPNYQSYACRLSEDFADAKRCERNQQRKNKWGTSEVSASLIHAEDGTAIYVMLNVAPVSLNRTIVEEEIEDLSRQINERPATLEWSPNGQGPTTLIAIWGHVRLEELNGDVIDTIKAGESPHLGVLVDTLGDLKLSAEQYRPIYRVSGGPGYLYAASFDGSGKGHRHYVAVDASQLATRQFRRSMENILEADKSLPNDDYRLWPKVAFETRRLARDTSPELANELLDKVFDAFHSDKLRSHVWAILPWGATNHLAANQYSRLDIYGPNTEHPKIRRDVQDFLAREPADRFAGFAHLLMGDFDKALAADANMLLSDVLHYGSGYKILQSLLHDALEVMKRSMKPDSPEDAVNELKYLLDEKPDTPNHVDHIVRVSNQFPELYDHKRLGSVIPNFAGRAAAAKVHFEAVLRHASVPQADDAAYMLGWLAFHQGENSQALAYFSQAMVVGNVDYKPAALRETVRILREYPPHEQSAIVESNKFFAQQPPLWYLAARSAYRAYDYAFAMGVAQRALDAIKIPIERLPVTTDPAKIEAALQRIDPRLSGDANVVELPYLLQASREISQYESYLNSAAAERSDVFFRKARAIIVKFSTLLDPPEQPAGGRPPPELAHKDLRQAIHLIDITLAATPQDAQHIRLRAWLYYRKVRVLAVYAPETVHEAVAAMEHEMPNSPVLNDALAEQIFAEGVMLKDVHAAEITFSELLRKYPNGNAVDNAHSWMAIIYRCAGLTQQAEDMNRKIIQFFPFTRHAKYAKERMSDPKNCGLTNW